MNNTTSLLIRYSKPSFVKPVNLRLTKVKENIIRAAISCENKKPRHWRGFGQIILKAALILPVR